MKRWQWLLTGLCAASVLVIEVVSWSWSTVAFRLWPSWIFMAVCAQLVPWPRSGWVAVALGASIDLFSPAPFGCWMLMLWLIVVVGEWIKTTWVKQASVLSAFTSIFFSLICATSVVWLWQLLAWLFPFISPVILLVPWWQWPIVWLVSSLLAAGLIRIIPSPYERLV